VMTYMRSLYPLDWQNFLVRLFVRTAHGRPCVVCVLQHTGQQTVAVPLGMRAAQYECPQAHILGALESACGG